MIRSVQRFVLRALRKLPRLQAVDRPTLLLGITASVIVSGCLAAMQFLVGEAFFNGRVISAEARTNTTLGQNIDNAKQLKANVNMLLADEILAPVRVDEGDNNFRVILDALPVTGDSATFAASLQNVILKHSGVSITRLSTDGASSVAPMDTVTPRTLRFSVEVAGDYTMIKTALQDIEKTIRPVKVTSFSVSGNGQNLSAKIAGVTYYLPKKTVTLEPKSMQRP